MPSNDSRRRPLGRQLLFSTLPAAVCLALIGIGYFVGRHRALAPLRDVARSSRSLTGLGSALDWSGLPRDIAPPAYLDPLAAGRDLDGYCYSPPGIPTPYVGSMPMPGVHLSATVGPQQFRHEADLLVRKPSGCFRVFVTGGSTAWGSGAPSNATTIPGFLERELRLGTAARPTVEVINAACPGWTTTHERILIENRICDLEPDLVIALTGTNDVHFGLTRFDVTWLRGYGDWPFWEIARLVYEGIGSSWQEISGRVPERPEPELVARRLCRNLRLAAEALRGVGERGVPLVFVLQPAMPASRKALSSREQSLLRNAREGRLAHLNDGGAQYFEACYAAIRSQAAQPLAQNYRFVDASRVFDEMGPGEEVFLDTYHFGDRGNQLIARFIAAAVR